MVQSSRDVPEAARKALLTDWSEFQKRPNRTSPNDTTMSDRNLGEPGPSGMSQYRKVRKLMATCCGLPALKAASAKSLRMLGAAKHALRSPDAHAVRVGN